MIDFEDEDWIKEASDAAIAAFRTVLFAEPTPLWFWREVTETGRMSP